MSVDNMNLQQSLLVMHHSLDNIKREIDILNGTGVNQGRSFSLWQKACAIVAKIVALFKKRGHQALITREMGELAKIVRQQPETIIDIFAPADRIMRANMNVLLGRMKDVVNDVDKMNNWNDKKGNKSEGLTSTLAKLKIINENLVLQIKSFKLYF